MSDEIIREYLPDHPGTMQLQANMSGMLIIHDSVWDTPMPLPETFIYVGGMGLHQKLALIPEVNNWHNS
jgi:hypothetical protein